MTTNDKPIANPLIVLREEFDDWALLFDPDSGHAFGINPVSVFIWRRLDGNHTVTDILTEMQDQFADVPPEAETHIQEFIDDLKSKGLAGYQFQA